MTSAALKALALVSILLSTTASAAETVEDLLFDLRLAPLDGRAPAPFTLPALDGGQRVLSELKGQVVLLYFWASW